MFAYNGRSGFSRLPSEVESSGLVFDLALAAAHRRHSLVIPLSLSLSLPLSLYLSISNSPLLDYN